MNNRIRYRRNKKSNEFDDDTKRFPGVEWYCDNCGARLDDQEGFTDHKYVWKCKNCNYKNSISRDNIINLENNKVLRLIGLILGLIRSASIYVILDVVFSSLIFHIDLLKLPKWMFFVSIIYPVVCVFSLIFETRILKYSEGSTLPSTVIYYIFDDIVRPFKEIGKFGIALFALFHADNKWHCFCRLIIIFLYLLIIIGSFTLLSWLIHYNWENWITWVKELYSTCKQFLQSSTRKHIIISALCIYYLIVNVVAIVLYGDDKVRATLRKWRISERTLLTIAFMGGGIGSLIGMRFFHHKTLKETFKIGVPVAIVLHLILLAVLFNIWLW